MKENDGRHLKLANLQNKKFGMLTVIRYNYDGTWFCKCDCGNYTNKLTSSLKKGKNPNCGCYIYRSNLKHNCCHERIYNIYEKMKSRCMNPDCGEYKYYGERGISVSSEWLGKDGFNNFYNWAMENGYSDKLSIDRINVDGNYEPLNCRWTTSKVQANNTRRNHLLTYNNETHTIAEWAEIMNMPYDRLHMRIKHGWDIEKALLTPKMANATTIYKVKGDN